MVISHSARIRSLVAVSGGILWLSIALVTGEREPWDSGLFWSVGLAGMLAVNGVAGYHLSDALVKNALSSVSVQPVIMIVMAGEIGSMFPLGLFVFMVLALIYTPGGWIGSTLRARHDGRTGKGNHGP